LKRERHELGVDELRVERETRAELIAVGIQLRDDVRLVLENDHVGAVSALEERHKGRVLLKHRESV
jgi:hypothetical protein